MQGMVSRNAAGPFSSSTTAPGGVVLQSVRLDSTAHSDMGNFLVEDYYGGDTQTTGDLNGSGGKGDQYVGLYENTSQDTKNTTTQGTTTITNATTISSPHLTRQDSATSLSSTPHPSTTQSPRYVAQYDYNDTSYDQDYNNLSKIHEAEGVGGFYSEDQDHVDSGMYDTELEEIPEDDIGEFEAYGEENEILNETDDHSVSVKSIFLDEEESLRSSTHSSATRSSITSADENTTGNMTKSVFGMNNFSLFGRPAVVEKKNTIEDVELTDFNPTIHSESQDNSLAGDTTEDVGITTTTTAAASPTVRVHYNHTDTTIPVPTMNTNLDTINSPNWLSQELGASTDGAGMLHLPSTITASTYNIDSFELSDTEEDMKRRENHNHNDVDLLMEHTEPEQVSYEADFGDYDDEIPFVPPVTTQPSSKHAGTVSVETDAAAPPVRAPQQLHHKQPQHQPLQPRNSELSTYSEGNEGNEGWQRFSSTSDDFFDKDASATLVPAPLPALLHPATFVDTPHTSTHTTVSTDPVKKPSSVKDYTSSQAAAVFDDLDRAWMQEQTDFVYDQPVRATLPTHVAKPVPSTQASVVPKATPVGSVPSVSKTAGSHGIVNKTAGKRLQSIEAAQWYQNPDQLEVWFSFSPSVLSACLPSSCHTLQV